MGAYEALFADFSTNEIIFQFVAIVVGYLWVLWFSPQVNIDRVG